MHGVRGETAQIFRAWHLYYEGLPWRGELWLDETLRLGPPSRLHERSLIGPRIIIVNQYVNAIDIWHAQTAFSVNLRELSVFLSVVLGTAIGSPPTGVTVGRGHPTRTARLSAMFAASGTGKRRCQTKCRRKGRSILSRSM